MKKLLSLTLSVILLILSANITLAEEADYPIYDVNVNGDYIVNDSFDDPTVYNPRLNISEVWQDVSGTNTQTGEIYTRTNNGNNEAVLERLVNNSNNSTKFLYHFKEDASAITDKFVVVEFTMRKSAKRETIVRICGTGSDNKEKIAFDITWQSGNKVEVKGAKEDGSTRYINLGEQDPYKDLHFKILFNTELHTYDLWMDANQDGIYEAKYEDVIWRNSFDTGISYLSATISRDTGRIYFDNIRAYKMPENDEMHARFARGAIKTSDLTDEPTGAITKDLNLPTSGKYDTKIEWSSDKPEVISQSGEVTRPGDVDTEVTLTAALSKGNSREYTKTFTFTVKSLNLSLLEYPYYDEEGEDSYIINDGFDTENNPSLNTGGQKDGVITWENGKIKLNKTESGTNFFSYLFDADKTNENITVFEFTVARKAQEELILRLTGDDKGQSNIAAQLTWGKDGSMRLYGISGSLATVTSTDDVHFKFLFNNTLKTYYMWVDSGAGYKLIGQNGKWRNSFNTSITCLYAYMQKDTTGEVFFDDIKVYKPTLSNYLRAKLDYDALSYKDVTSQAPDNIIYDFEPLSTGIYGSEITWESSNPDVIAIDDNGFCEVKRDALDDKTVTLSATCIYENSAEKFQDRKELVFTVAKLPQGGELPTLAESAEGRPNPIAKLESPMENTTSGSFLFDNANPFKGTYGLKVTVEAVENTDLTIAPQNNTISGDAIDVFAIKAKEGKLYIDYRGSASDIETSSIMVKSNFDVTGEKTYTFLIDTDTNKVSAWINDEKIAEALYTANEIREFNRILVSSSAPVTIKDIEFFHPVLSGQDKVLFDYEYYKDFSYITFQDIEGVYEDITLPTEGKFGSTIIWESSSPSVLSNQGEVVGPGETTLTGIIKSGEDEKQVSFLIKVVERNIGEPWGTVSDENPLEADLIYEWDFKDKVDESTLSMTSIKDVSTVGIKKGKFSLNCIAYSENDSKLSITYPERALVGLVGMELEIFRDKAATIHLAAGNASYFSADWESGQFKMKARIKEENGELVSKEQLYKTTSNSAKLRILFDNETQSYNLWINGERISAKNAAGVDVGKDLYSRFDTTSGISLFSAWVNKINGVDFRVGRMALYKVYAPKGERTEKDQGRLTLNHILTHEPNKLNPILVKENLNLPKRGYYGSYIKWESSDVNLLSNEGVINFDNVNALDSDPETAVTATFYETKADMDAGTNGIEKTITFKIQRKLTDSNDIIDSVISHITEESILAANTSKDEVKSSLDLSIQGGNYGEEISWATSNDKIITTSGRVIRPKAGAGNKEVAITVTVSFEGQSQSKTLNFTVVDEEEYQDPNHLSDEAFFGRWNAQSNTWDVAGTFNYSYNDGMKKVGEVVKGVQDGDYTPAKEELLSYMRNREDKSGVSGTGNQTTGESYIDGYLKHVAIEGSANIANGWKHNPISVRTSALQKGGKVTYSISSWYNEATELLVDPAKSYLRVFINGEKKEFPIAKAVTIRAGSYKRVPFNEMNADFTQYLRAKTFGEFNGDDTYKIVMSFDLGANITEENTITNAELVLYSTAAPLGIGSKRIIVLAENNTTWIEKIGEGASWSNFTGLAFNFNGLDGKWQWIRPDGDATDQEYFYQRTRFLELPNLAKLYASTKSEKWAEGAIGAMGDFVKEAGALAATTPSTTLPGIFPRSLDAAERVLYFSQVYDTFAQSEAMTTEYNTAILKHLWQATNTLLIEGKAHQVSEGGNWVTNEQSALLNFEKYFPEFKDQPQWLDITKGMFVEIMKKNINADGSYIESTSGYTNSAFEQFFAFRKTLMEMGEDPGDEYNERLLKAAVYNAILVLGNGRGLAWGDANSGSKGAGIYEEFAKLFDNEKIFTNEEIKEIVELNNMDEFRYIDNYARKGDAPSWTSIHYPDSKRVLMRSDWSKNSVSLFTEVNGLRQHGHADDNAIILAAFGRTLLTDAGRFSYQRGGEDTTWGSSSMAHNTVLIGNTSQGGSSDLGVTDDWHTGSAFDYSEQTTKASEGFKHTRNVTFVKPDLFIVSDLIVPNQDGIKKNYKQQWHMMYDSNISYDEESRAIRSNYPKGANLIIASADADARAVKQMGWYDIGYETLMDNPYYSFEKDVTGKASFDSILLPANNDPEATVKATRINTGVDVTTATALKLESKIKGVEETGYYYLSREENPSQRSFGEFETDAKLFYIGYDKDSNVTNLVIRDGSYIKKNGEYIINIGEKATVSAVVDGKTIRLDSFKKDTDAEKKDIESAEVLTSSKIIASSSFNKLTINGATASYTKDGNYITPDIGSMGGETDGEGEENEKEEISAPSGELIPLTPSEGAGGGSEENYEEKPAAGEESTNASFSDTKGHWAEKEIAELYTLGVVTGRTKDMYCPDENVTRAEFLTLISRGIGIRAAIYQGGFDDVKRGDWFADTVAAAMAQGIISKGTHFRPNDPITREEMAKMICIATRLFYREDLLPGYKADYVDVSPDSWSADYINAADYFELIRGVGNNSFAPLSNATRAQCAVIIKRAMNLVKN